MKLMEVRKRLEIQEKVDIQYPKIPFVMYVDNEVVYEALDTTARLDSYEFLFKNAIAKGKKIELVELIDEEARAV